MADHLRLAVQQVGPIRIERVWNRDWKVFPATLVREQVLNNNLGPTFLPAEEIAASVEAWNAIPVVVRHPTSRGAPISARDPHVLNGSGVGFVFRARFADNALKADVFLDPALVESVEDAGEAVQNVEKGEAGELSTGFGTNIERAEGTFDGREFSAILRNIRPDHLALLPDAVGACSVEDGCGLGVNHEGPCDTEGGVDEKTEGRFAQALDRLVAFLSRAETPDVEAPEPDPGTAEHETREEGDTMNRDQMIAHLAEAGRDKEALNKLSDCDLKALMGAGAQNSAPEPQGDGWDKAREWREKYETLSANTQPAVEAQNEERAELIDDILYSRNCQHSDAEVKAMNLGELRKIHRYLYPQAANYAGRGGPRADGEGFSTSFVQPILSGRRGESVLDRKEVN